MSKCTDCIDDEFCMIKMHADAVRENDPDMADALIEACTVEDEEEY